MSPTSRNTLMIGGALILIALFLVCGPLSDRLGSGGKSVEEPPSVAAGPPIDAAESLAVVEPTDVVEAVTAGAGAGALVGTSLLETNVAGSGGVNAEEASSVVPVAPVVVAEQNDDQNDGMLTGAGITGAGAVAAGTAVGLASDSGAGGGGTALPPVSAGVPSTTVAAGEMFAVGEGDGATSAAAAAGAFDDSFASAMVSADGLGAAGRVVERFPPPVAAAGGSPLALAAAAQPFGVDSGDLLRPCDSPGSGCSTLTPSAVGGGVTPFGSGSPRGAP